MPKILKTFQAFSVVTDIPTKRISPTRSDVIYEKIHKFSLPGKYIPPNNQWRHVVVQFSKINILKALRITWLATIHLKLSAQPLSTPLSLTGYKSCFNRPYDFLCISIYLNKELLVGDKVICVKNFFVMGLVFTLSIF